MNFHIVKMYKDKEVNKNVKNMVLSMCDVSVFDIYFNEIGTALTTNTRHTRYRRKTNQTKIHHREILVTLDTQDTGGRQTKQKYNTERYW